MYPNLDGSTIRSHFTSWQVNRWTLLDPLNAQAVHGMWSPLSRTHHTPAPRPDSAHNPTPGDMATGFIGIAWLRNSTVVHEFPQLQHENFSKTFILSPTEVNDYTLYQADIYTVDGRILTVDFVVGEFVPPLILFRTPHNPEISVVAPMFVEIFCQPTGTPAPEIRWERDGEVLVGSERITIIPSEVSSTLYINRTAAGDGGTYSCVASNVTGAVSSSFFLSVIGEQSTVLIMLGISIRYPSYSRNIMYYMC